MTSKNTTSLTYCDAGVDINKGDELIERIKPFAQKTLRSGVLKGIGGFGALFELSTRYREPVLVSGTDGVGTKLKLALQLNRHETIGQDLVAMSVNDILVQGAEPLFFLDYFACGKLDIGIAEAVIKGIADGCELANCALMGGETAEMPDMYPIGEYDLAGFAVGAVEKNEIIDGSTILPGDVVLGLASSGIHANGYSLVRKIIQHANLDLNAAFENETLGDALLKPTRIYVKSILSLKEKGVIKGLAHITGGGIVGNMPRVLPEQLMAEIDQSKWKIPSLFQLLQTSGNVADAEMHRVFNCGIGMIVVVAPEDATCTKTHLLAEGEIVEEIGVIRQRNNNEAQTTIVREKN